MLSMNFENQNPITVGLVSKSSLYKSSVIFKRVARVKTEQCDFCKHMHFSALIGILIIAKSTQ